MEAKPEVNAVLEGFKKFAEWKKYPLPEVIYKKYGVEMPDPHRPIRDFLQDFERTRMLPGDSEVEIRPPAPGGLRVLGELKDKPEVTFQNVSSRPEEKQTQLEDSTRANDSRTPPSEDQNESSPQ